MKEEAIRFISEVVKPWETLNQKLAAPFSMNPAINDFITIANALTVSIKHLPEAIAKIKPEVLAKEFQSYEIISDLADSLKHGELRKPERECKLSVSSMFERNEKEMKFIDFDFHMVCPIFIDLSEPIFFDYTDYRKPKIIINNVDTNFYQYFEDIPNTSYIEYKKLNFSFEKLTPTKTKIGVHNIDMIPGEIGVYEKPIWIHEEKWPICPINNKKMKFLFQFGDIDESVTIIGQEILDKEYIDPYLNFGHGYLYVFYEPESKVIAYLNQL